MQVLVLQGLRRSSIRSMVAVLRASRTSYSFYLTIKLVSLNVLVFKEIAVMMIFIFLTRGQSKSWLRYVYKVCPFKHASQEEGHSTTRLG